MSIESEILRIQNNIADTYAAVEDMGGDVPLNPKAASLAEAVRSIPSAGFGTPTATVDDNTGTPSVSVSATGPDTAKVFNFAFKNLKGATGAQGSKGDKGDTGPQGIQGPKGDKGDTGAQGPAGAEGAIGATGAAAGFGTPAATVDANTGTPSVTVSATGPDTAKVFTFTFKNLKGATGAQGPKGDKGDTGAQGPAGTDGVGGASNAGAHNSIYRGKLLGTSVTSSQYSAIKAGTFGDLYIGDYWTINNVNYRIAAFDYYLNCGDTRCTAHHIVVVPDTCLYEARMHTSDSTAGGYVGSAMYTDRLSSAHTTFLVAFGSHLLSHRILLSSSMANNRASAVSWCSSEVDLMSEQMVYGGPIFSPLPEKTLVPMVTANSRVEKSQLPLFALAPEFITVPGKRYWLRDIVCDYQYAMVGTYGEATYLNAFNTGYVRPFACIS